MSHKLEPVPLAIPEALRAELPECFATPHAARGFRNPWAHPPLPGIQGVLRWKMGKNEARARDYQKRALPVPAQALADFEALDATSRVFWLGHASFLMAIDGVRFVVDPIFGRAAGMIPRVTPPPVEPEELSDITAVLVTHGHHDHLDPPSLKRLALNNRDSCVFVVPRGLGVTLPSVCRPVVELSWWEHITLSGVRVHLVPAQHWHRRGAFDTNASLWGGFVLEGTHRVYHSGDTGYFRGFEAIGRVFGGIDAACLPLGAYEPKWFMATQHMSPEGSLAAYHDLRASHFIGMHWGTFDLSDEAPTAGPGEIMELVHKEQLDAGAFHVVLPGGTVALDGPRGETRARTLHAYREHEPSEIEAQRA
jgi:L-ascorbate metabolism protein UlaG (beta-lactamase superfamily)